MNLDDGKSTREVETLSDKDEEKLQDQIQEQEKTTSFFNLFRFASATDIILVATGVFFAAVHGVALPMFTLVMGGLVNMFRDFFNNEESSSSFRDQTGHLSLYFVYIGVGTLLATCLETTLLVHRGEIVANKYRKNFLQAVVHQNVAYFEKIGSGEISTRIINDTMSIQEAISEKLGHVVMGISSFVTSVVIGLVMQWKLSLILFCAVGYNLLVMGGCAGILVKYYLRSDEIYSKGSSVAEEALGSMRTVVAFGGQEKIIRKFDRVLKTVLSTSNKASLVFSLMLAFVWAGLFWVYALGFWEASRIIAWGETDVGRAVAATLAMLIGSIQLGEISPNMRFIVKGITACKKINETIDRIPVINSGSDEGIVPQRCLGRLSLSNIHFKYPCRPDITVLNDISFVAEAGKTVALVGSSGSGKSTIIGLIERFYLPLNGSIKIDGVDIERLNVRWLRRQIGYVQQEPVLFNDSVFENVCVGLIGSEYEFSPDEIKLKKVIQACKESNAHDFIMQLTDGYRTTVGNRGVLLSGGQKQRIAIARAIVSNPPILLLDEATSALDTNSEKIVQKALDCVSISRTTIVIAHRLSTIKNSDSIIVMSHGRIIEHGTHQDLINWNGVYASHVAAQQVPSAAIESERSAKFFSDHYDNEESQLPLEKTFETPLYILDSFNMKKTSLLGEKDSSNTTPSTGVRFIHYMKMLWNKNRSEHCYLVLGAVFAVLLGYCYPAMGIVSARIIGDMMVPSSMYKMMRSRVDILGWWLFFVGVMSWMFAFVTIFCMSFANNRLVRRIRLQLFAKLMRMDIGFFEDTSRGPGTFVSMLAKDAKAIEGLGGATLRQILQSISTLVGGIATGIAFSWRIGLVAMSIVPVLLLCGFLRVWVLKRISSRSCNVHEISGAMAAQYTSSITTVQSLTYEEGVVEKYCDVISGNLTLNEVLCSAILYAVSQGLTPWTVALVFWWGSDQMSRGNVEVSSFFVSFTCIVLGSEMAGEIFSYSPDMGKALAAAANIYSIENVVPVINSDTKQGIICSDGSFLGDIELKNVYFNYPMRPDIPVFRGVSLSAGRGQYIALVGSSGCGKSTAIGLLERFYDVKDGEILLDGISITEYNIQSLRSNVALVEQEPALHSGSIRENILMGWTGDDSEVTSEMIFAAAQKANIHDFVMSLPEGYETELGYHGTNLSGGQKQRIAIARALIRDPRILLLDEATSSLDSDSEVAVQKALDEAARGRTTIAVAHRLSSIQNADIIYVLHKGVVVEQGTHASLLSKNGRYADLASRQALV